MEKHLCGFSKDTANQGQAYISEGKFHKVILSETHADNFYPTG